MSSITPVMYRSIFLFAFFAVTQTGEVRSELPWTELLYKIKFLNLKHCIVGYLDHSKSAEKFVSFDQINYKRVNLEDDTLKERRIGKFSFIFDPIVLFRTSFYFDILMHGHFASGFVVFYFDGDERKYCISAKSLIL